MYAPLATIVLRAVFVQSLSRRRLSDMFDIKGKSSATNRRVVTRTPLKTNRRRQIVADESRGDVYAVKDKSSQTNGRR